MDLKSHVQEVTQCPPNWMSARCQNSNIKLCLLHNISSILKIGPMKKQKKEVNINNYFCGHNLAIFGSLPNSDLFSLLKFNNQSILSKVIIIFTYWEKISLNTNFMLKFVQILADFFSKWQNLAHEETEYEFNIENDKFNIEFCFFLRKRFGLWKIHFDHTF